MWVSVSFKAGEDGDDNDTLTHHSFEPHVAQHEVVKLYAVVLVRESESSCE